MLDGLLYHESDLRIEEHYTDTAGFTDHVFALMHFLGFRFASRLRDLGENKTLCAKAKPSIHRAQARVTDALYRSSASVPTGMNPTSGYFDQRRPESPLADAAQHGDLRHLEEMMSERGISVGSFDSAPLGHETIAGAGEGISRSQTHGG